MRQEQLDVTLLNIATRKGLHIISNFQSSKIQKLKKFESFKAFIDNQIQGLSLNKIGEVYHDFPGGGYTAVVCLSESHLSIHTWPDNKYVTFDVYLSNHQNDNSTKTQGIYEAVLGFFEAMIIFENKIDR